MPPTTPSDQDHNGSSRDDSGSSETSVLDRTIVSNDGPVITEENTNSSQGTTRCGAQSKRTRAPATNTLLQEQTVSINRLAARLDQVVNVLSNLAEVVGNAQTSNRPHVRPMPVGNVAHGQNPSSDPGAGANRPVVDNLNGLSRDNQENPSSNRAPSAAPEQPRQSATSRLPEPTYFDPNFGAPRPSMPIINQIQPPTFEGDRAGAREWLIRYERDMNINGYDDDAKLLRVSAYLRDEASQWLTTKQYLTPDLDWWIFKRSFLRHFCGTDETTFLRRKLEEAKQKNDENPSSFLVRIVHLCKQFKPDMSDSGIVDKVSRGLNKDTYNMLATREPKENWTVSWLTEMFERFRTTSEKTSREASRGDGKSRKSVSSKESSNGKPRDLSTWKCFNCGETGHVVENCPQPRDEAKYKARLEEHRRQKLKKSQDKERDGSKEQRSVQALNSEQVNSSGAKVLAPSLACDTVIKPFLTIELEGKLVKGRIDTGADITAIPRNVALDLSLRIAPWDQPALRAVGNSIDAIGMASVLATHENAKRALLVAVFPDDALAQPLWGMDLLDAFAIQLNFGQTKVTDRVVSRTTTSILNVEIVPNHPIDKVKIGEIDNDSLESLHGMLEKFADVFSRDERDIGRTSTVKHRIILSDPKPIHKNYYRIHHRRKSKLQEVIDKNLATGAFRPSKSSYASPAFFVEKDDGADLRLVADFRGLNEITVKDRTPMPHPEDVFGMLAGQKYFAKLDITSMFNQIEVEEEDIHKTAVITERGLFECPLMPFGLVNAPATAVKLMREVLRDLDTQTCFVYFDDIIVFAPTINNLVQRCTEILERLKLHNLKLKPSKCTFAMDSVNFLGHKISARGVEMDPGRIERVLKFKVPRNPSDVRSFHGLCSYNRKFIKGFAEIAKPLTPLMGKPSDFVWTVEAQKAFETLRDALTKTPILTHFDPAAEHELRTDASSYAVGAVFFQIHEDPERSGVISYYSKTLNAAQKRYSTTERELLAAHMAIMEFKHYLLGKRFTLITDHSPLRLLQTHKDPHHRLARWVANLMQFDFVVKPIRGSSNVDADTMSRLIEENDPDADDEDLVARPFEEIIRMIQQVTTNSDQVEANEAQPTVEVIADPSVDIRQEQRQDEFCRRIIDLLEADLSPSELDKRCPHFAMLDDQLHRVNTYRPPTLVVPARRRAAILISLHDSPFGAHLGFQRTYNKIRDRYFWPKMRRDIKKYVASCHKCQRRKVSNVRRQGLTRPLPVAEEVFDTIGIDLITKLPKSNSGHIAILVCTDNLSKLAITVPLKDETADTIIHAFVNHVISVYGCPRLVISDRGINLAGEQARDFFRLYGIIRHVTTPYHPQANGQTERFNRTIATSLTMYVNKHQRDWPDFLQVLTFAYNISDHSVTRVAPFELVFGRRPRLPIDNVLDRSEFVDPTRPAPGTLSTEAVNLMKKYIIETQAKNKRRLDARLADTTFQEGDLVLVERPTRVRGTANKLSYTYIGPYRIVKKHNDLSFNIAFPTGRPINNVVHVRHLRKYIRRDENITDEIVDPTFVPRPTRVAPGPVERIEPIDQSDNESEIESPPIEPLTPPRDVPNFSEETLSADES